MADAIIKQRAGPDGVDGTEDDMPFRRDPAAIDRLWNQRYGGLCDVRSSTFEVHVTAQIGDLQTRICRHPRPHFGNGLSSRELLLEVI